MFGKFNSALQNCILCYAPETFWAGDKQSEGVLKDMITRKEQMFESKFKNVIKLESHLNLIFSSNEDWVVPVGKHERRFFVPTLSEEKRNPSYFNELRSEWKNGGAAAMLHDLMQMPINVDYFRNVPETDGLIQQAKIGMSLIEQFC